MNIPKVAKLKKTVGRINNYRVDGDTGGNAIYNFDINDTTGAFKGNVVYSSFSSGGIVLEGETTVEGVFDIYYSRLIRLSVSFDSLNLNTDNSTFTLTGSLSWGFSLSRSVENLSMNMVLLDKAVSKTYWFNNYEVHTEFNNESYSQSISGRYYDHDYGYVDIETRMSIFVTLGNMWPSEGVLSFQGKSDTRIDLSFNADSLLVEADTDGDGNPDVRVERETNILPPVDSPPIANAGPDQRVAQWTTVTLDGTASSDLDGDPLYYDWYLVSAPQNTYVSLNNRFSATPTFIPEKTGTYVFSLHVSTGFYYNQSDTVTIVVTPSTLISPDSVSLKSQYGIFGYNVGRAGLLTADFDGNGTPEIITSSNNGYSDTIIYMARWTSNGEFEQVWRSPIFQEEIQHLFIDDINNDLKDDLIVALTDGNVQIFYGPYLTGIRNLTLGTAVKDMAFVDIDADGKKEMITTDGLAVSVYNDDLEKPKWTASTGGGCSLAVGNVDHDASLEIVTTTNGGRGYVLNGLSGAIKWTYANSFGSIVKLHDLDDDGMKEIISTGSSYKITIFDADLKSPTWEISTSYYNSDALISDTNGDGVPEIIYYNVSYSTLHVIDVRTREEIRKLYSQDSIGSSIALADMDLDGFKELIFGTQLNLIVSDPFTSMIKWKSPDVGLLSSFSVGDMDHDGEQDIIAVGNPENIVLNALDLKMKHDSPSTGFFRFENTGDVDGDGHSDVVKSDRQDYKGIISVYDGTTYALKNQSAEYPQYSFFSQIALGDVDSDGKTEIVSALYCSNDESEGVYLIVFDGAALEEKWRTGDLGRNMGTISDIRISDIDKDGKPELIALQGQRRLIVCNGANHTIDTVYNNDINAFDVADVDEDGSIEILCGGDYGMIQVLDGTTYAKKDNVFIFNKSDIYSLTVNNLDNTGSPEWIITSEGGYLTILQGSPEGHGLIWQSEYLGMLLCHNNPITIKDIDMNGYPDIFVGSNTDFYRFEFKQ